MSDKIEKLPNGLKKTIRTLTRTTKETSFEDAASGCLHRLDGPAKIHTTLYNGKVAEREIDYYIDGYWYNPGDYRKHPKVIEYKSIKNKLKSVRGKDKEAALKILEV